MSRLDEALYELDLLAQAKCNRTPNESECFEQANQAKTFLLEHYKSPVSVIADAFIDAAIIGVVGIVIYLIFVRLKRKSAPVPK